MTTVPTINRELTPFEHAVLKLVCDGLTNAAIAREIHHSEKVIENTVSRAAQAFVIEERQQHNLRVMIALAYRAHFGDGALQKLDPKIRLDFSPSEVRTPTYSQAS